MSGGQERREFFDRWAERYDEAVRKSTGFPFDGYDDVLEAVVRKADVQPSMWWRMPASAPDT